MSGSIWEAPSIEGERSTIAADNPEDAKHQLLQFAHTVAHRTDDVMHIDEFANRIWTLCPDAEIERHVTGEIIVFTRLTTDVTGNIVTLPGFEDEDLPD